MKKSRLAYGFATSIGLGRRSNQDAWLASPDLGVFIVADGVGGGSNGDVASKTVTESVAESLRSEAEADNLDEVMDRVSAGLKRAHDKLRAMPVDDDAQRKSCATTVVGLAVEMPDAEQVGVLSVGDSRIYRFRDGRLDCLTTDDARWRWRGWHGFKRLPFRKYLTQAVGTPSWKPAAPQRIDAQIDDLYVLCTDGLWGVLGRNGLSAILMDTTIDMQAVANKLVEQALQLGGRDNITCCVVRIMAVDELDVDSKIEQTSETAFHETQEIKTAEIESHDITDATDSQTHETDSKAGSMLVELVILFGFSATVSATILADMHLETGLLAALRDFCGRIMVVIGVPLL